ncbi:hypothetical protein [Treponema lecithinolyticum]
MRTLAPPSGKTAGGMTVTDECGSPIIDRLSVTLYAQYRQNVIGFV